jgi:hypothetical protein
MKIVALSLVLALSGCAQWNQMTDQEKGVVIGTAILVGVLGYAAGDHDETIVVNPAPKPPECWHEHHC